MLIWTYLNPAKFFPEPLKRLHAFMLVAFSQEDNLPPFAVVSDDIDFDSSVVSVTPIKRFHALRPWSFIAANVPTTSPDGW